MKKRRHPTTRIYLYWTFVERQGHSGVLQQQRVNFMKKAMPASLCGAGRFWPWKSINDWQRYFAGVDRWRHSRLQRLCQRCATISGKINMHSLPSYREGMPRIVLEAMAMGKPVITTKTAGCRETVEEGVNSYLAEARMSTTWSERWKNFVPFSGAARSHGGKRQSNGCSHFTIP